MCLTNVKYITCFNFGLFCLSFVDLYFFQHVLLIFTTIAAALLVCYKYIQKLPLFLSPYLWCHLLEGYYRWCNSRHPYLKWFIISDVHLKFLLEHRRAVFDISKWCVTLSSIWHFRVFYWYKLYIFSWYYINH